MYINLWSPTEVMSSHKCVNPTKPLLLTYDTSFLKRSQVVINGDIESNPGPISSIEAYRAAIGRFYGKAKINGITHGKKGINLAFYLLIMAFYLHFCICHLLELCLLVTSMFFTLWYY